MSVGGAGKKGLHVSVPEHNRSKHSSAIIRLPLQPTMEVQVRGKQLAVAGGSSTTASNSSFCCIAAAKPERLAVSSLQQQADSNALSSHDSKASF